MTVPLKPLIIFLYLASLIVFIITGPLIMNKLKDLDNDIYYNYFATGYAVSLVIYFIILYSIIDLTFMRINWIVLVIFFISYIVLILVPALIPTNKKYKNIEEAKALIYTYCSFGLLLLLIFAFFMNKKITAETYSIVYTDISTELKGIYEENKTKEDFGKKCIDKLMGKKYGEINLSHDEYQKDGVIIYDIGTMERNGMNVNNSKILDTHIPRLCDVFYNRFNGEGTP